MSVENRAGAGIPWISVVLPANRMGDEGWGNGVGFAQVIDVPEEILQQILLTGISRPSSREGASGKRR